MCRGICFSYTLKIEGVSCDELYADLTELCGQVNLDPPEVASAIRAEIFEKNACTASAGLGKQCSRILLGYLTLPSHSVTCFVVKI